ncbi:hypothetical protein [Rhizobacter sp. OV335]|uniref:hypothetical protein n=1 Tax=Rhizobacter sp. OV335 TaxID=1500264 RepID=UPI000916C5F7|nr:hypothetical protein [Rhizobacter sp. OV335]SHN38409.1 hypothetical protein SAMN02787076_05905 [Rhizobacter sp. OV335]
MKGARALLNGYLGQGFQSDNPERLTGGGTQYLAISTPGDRLQLDPSVQILHAEADAHLRRCGLNPTTEVVWDQRAVPLLPGESYVPCMFDHAHAPQGAMDQEWARKWQQVIKLASMKSEFPGVMEEWGFSGLTPKSLVSRPGNEVIIPLDMEPVWIKRVFETSGGVNVEGPLEDADLDAAVRRFRRRGEAFQVQEHIPGDDYSNQYFVEWDGTLRFLGSTKQVVIGGHHAGNESSKDDWGPLTHAIARKLAALGLRGFFGIDFRVDGLMGLVTEFNLRVNGSSVPEYLRWLFGLKSVFLIRETPVNPKLQFSQVFDRLQDAGLEFDPITGGAMVYLFGWFLTGHTLGIAIYGDDPRPRYDEVSRLLLAS